jgi:hypothetical protein
MKVKNELLSKLPCSKITAVGLAGAIALQPQVSSEAEAAAAFIRRL